jgi:hypothetical protein
MGDEGRECMKYLSRNEAKAIYVESAEERLVLKLRELIEAQDKENAQIKAVKDKRFKRHRSKRKAPINWKAFINGRPSRTVRTRGSSAPTRPRRLYRRF